MCRLIYETLLGPRLVKTQVEVEMEVEQMEGDEASLQEPIITIEEEEEVVLFWEQSTKSKGIRELAMASTESIREDKEIIDYYR